MQLTSPPKLNLSTFQQEQDGRGFALSYDSGS
jgi:hypothetical protein